MQEPYNRSAFERRRQEPLHYAARAEAARFSAFLLARAVHDENAFGLARDCGYGGSPTIAIGDGFDREAAIALELILKAVITQRLLSGPISRYVSSVPLHHDVPLLWNDAGLRNPPPDDYGRLVLAKVILVWAGRYPAPVSDKEGEKHDEELWRHAMRPAGLSIDIRQRVSFDWADFDRLFQIAADELDRLRSGR